MPKKKVTEAVEETAQETIPVEKAPAQMPRRQGSEDLLELNDLERGGYIQRQRRHRENGSCTSNLYIINICGK